MALIDKDKLKAEIKRRLSLIYLLEGDFTDGSRDAYEGLLSWLDTLKETPTWVIRAEQRKKDQASGKKFAIMEIRAEIERRMFEDYNGSDTEQNETAQGVCAGLLAFLDTIPEQPDSDEKFRNLLDAMGDCGFSQDNILLLKSIWEDAYGADKKAVKEIVKTVHKEVTRQVKEMVGKQPVIKKSNALFEECLANVDPAIRKEVSDNIDKILGRHPVEGLEEEIEKYFQGWFNDDEYGDAVTPDYTGVGVDECKEIARYFYDLGCRRTAVMYDDIEYERQRAEEAELSRDLEEEVKRYWNGHALDHRIGRVADIDFLHLAARHFAEWGAEHLKK